MNSSIISAIEDFHRARRRAALKRITDVLRGRSSELLSYEDVRKRLHAVESSPQRLQQVPVAAIVGSVGRYKDFTRDFLPMSDNIEQRWTGIRVAAESQQGLPPVELYRIGEAYFVKDGNHRISVARQLGHKTVEAYVTEVHTDVPLSPDVTPDELILKEEYVDFLAKTDLRHARPDADLTVTVPGKYAALLEHIRVHHYFMGLEAQRDVPYREAVKSWYDTVYLPTVRLIRERGLLQDFPDHSETDLYIWLAQYRAELEQEVGWEIEPEAAASHLVQRHGQRKRGFSRLAQLLVPLEGETLYHAAPWSRERPPTRLLGSLLVALNGTEAGWQALETSFLIAQHEGARLYALHVVPTVAQRESEAVRALEAEFTARCEAAGVRGRLKVEVGEVVRSISEHAHWADLVVISLSYPPGRSALDRLSSSLRMLLQRCSRPVLTVPAAPPSLRRAIVAYDASPKAEEALFLATYIALGWDVLLTVLAIQEDGKDPEDILAKARGYLVRYDLQASYRADEGGIAHSLIRNARDSEADLIIMGGYSTNPLLGVVIGSAVDETLRLSSVPTLICR